MKNKLIAIMLLWVMCGNATHNLQEMEQDFVSNTKRITLTQYPYAFNPSIIRFHDKLLLSFRVIPDKKEPFTSWLGLVWLDEDFNPVSEPQKLDELRDKNSSVPPRMEDGRLIVVNDTLYLVYSDNEDEVITRGGFRMYIAQLQENNGIFSVEHKSRLSMFEGSSEVKREKNWAPFVYEDRLLLSYSLSPHKVFAPMPETNSCKMIAKTYNKMPWQWGELRGGTPALLQDDHYLGFFHSFIKLETVHNAKKAPHYFMGAYLLEGKYPFRVTHISKEPIVGKHFYEGESYKPYWGSVQVVFPGGFIQNDERIWVVFGRQDHEMWVTEIAKAKLYENLVPVQDTTSKAKRYILSFLKEVFDDLLDLFFNKPEPKPKPKPKPDHNHHCHGNHHGHHHGHHGHHEHHHGDNS